MRDSAQKFRPSSHGSTRMLSKSALSRPSTGCPRPHSRCQRKARAEKLILLEAELLQCEREEEALIERAEEGEGPLVIRRLNADPRAVLCLGFNRDRAAKPEGKVERVRANDAA